MGTTIHRQVQRINTGDSWHRQDILHRCFLATRCLHVLGAGGGQGVLHPDPQTVSYPPSCPIAVCVGGGGQGREEKDGLWKSYLGQTFFFNKNLHPDLFLAGGC